MKHLITSVDALIDSTTNSFFDGICEELDKFLQLNAENKVIVVSIRSNRLALIPKRFNPIRIPSNIRGSGEPLLEYISKVLKCVIDDPIILGCKKYDMYSAAHLKAILLTAYYAIANNPTDEIYVNSYGVPLNVTASIGFFFDAFYGVQDPWFFKLQVSNKTTLYALTDANTFASPVNIVTLNEIKEKFKECLKEGDTQHIVPFTSYFLVGTHLIMKEFENIDYWDYYPTSSGEPDNVLSYFTTKARQSFKKNPLKHGHILIRKEATYKRHEKQRSTRITIGCTDQIKTIKINPAYEHMLKDKTVCIIDDFTNIGTSCETARILLEAAGVRKLIFVALGKFSRVYNKYEYELTGDIYTDVIGKQLGISSLTGTFNDNSNYEFLKLLGTL